jgi:hypothetical protein
MIALTGCAFFSEKRWEFRIVDRSQKSQVLLASDSPEARKLLADEDARENEMYYAWREKRHTLDEDGARYEDMRKHPELYPPGRAQFLEEMAKLPGFAVPVKSYCSVIERSKSTCGATPLETTVYVFIKITSGPFRGKQGWVCETHVHSLFP